jgi:hypothetical protein
MNDSPIPKKAPRGRPAIVQPAGRDLAAELIDLKEWFEKHPATKPGTISVAAGLNRAALGHVLRGYRSPQATALDAVYKALEPYQYKPRPIESKNN